MEPDVTWSHINPPSKTRPQATLTPPAMLSRLHGLRATILFLCLIDLNLIAKRFHG